MKILIVYYSLYGHTYHMARAVEKGVTSVPGVEAEPLTERQPLREQRVNWLQGRKTFNWRKLLENESQKPHLKFGGTNKITRGSSARIRFQKADDYEPISKTLYV